MMTPLVQLLQRHLPAWAILPGLVLIYFGAALMIILFIGHQPDQNPYMDVGAN